MKKILLSILLIVSSLTSRADTLTVVVPWAAGGATDQVWRTIQPELSFRLQKNNIVLETEYRPGAGGGLGIQHIVNSNRPMLAFTSASLAISPQINDTVRYNHKDLQVLGIIGSYPLVLLTNAKRFGSLDQLLVNCRNRPITVGNSGPGGMTHMSTQVLSQETGCNMISVPYRSATLALPELINGSIDAVMDHPSGTVSSMITQGLINSIFTSQQKKSSSWQSLNNWHVLVSNQPLQGAQLEHILEALQQTLTDSVVVQRLQGLGLIRINQPVSSTWLSSQWNNLGSYLGR